MDCRGAQEEPRARPGGPGHLKTATRWGAQEEPKRKAQAQQEPEGRARGSSRELSKSQNEGQEDHRNLKQLKRVQKRKSLLKPL